MKRILFTFIFVIVANIGITHATLINGTCGENLTWVLNTQDSTLIINGSGTMEYSIVPWENGKAYIKWVNLPEGLTNIGKMAFMNCYNLSSVTIPTTVGSIEDSAFRGCRFEYINIPSSVVSIGSYAFKDCWLKSVSLTNGVMSIGAEAFYECHGLTSIVIPNSVTSIGNYAFYDCENLTSAVLSNNITTIPNSLFSHCGKLSSVNIPNCVTSIGNNAFNSCNSLASVTIPNSVIVFENAAFRGCSSLTSIEIPNSVTSIGNNAFYGCNSLASVTIPNGVTSIGEGAFKSCEKLLTINVASENPNYSSIDGVLFNKIQSTLIQYPGGKQGGYDIPESILIIEQYAFQNSRTLSSITVNNSVTTIKNSTFDGCSNLADIFLGTAVKIIETNAFANCNAIQSITCYSKRPPTVNSSFPQDMPFSTIIYVPIEYLDSYGLHDFWGLFDVRAMGESQYDSVNVHYVDKEGSVIAEEAIDFHFPEVPQVNGFTFIGWRPVANIIEDNTIEIEAVYEADEPSSSAAVNIPGNDTQKLIRKGNVYILTGDKTYTIQGQKIK